MAKVLYDIYQIKNAKSSVVGRYFARAVPTETIDTEGLAHHIFSHGSSFTEEDIEGILKKAEKCIVEQLLDSKKVKLNKLGTFYLSVQNRKGGAESVEDFSITQNVQGLRIRFLPEQADNSSLTSKSMMQKANFKWAEELKRDSAAGKPDSGGGGDDGE